MYVPILSLKCFLTSFLQGFSALLEPFYGGKSLTDPINTAEARISTIGIRILSNTPKGQVEFVTGVSEGQGFSQATY